jgi:hypothetical protein
MVLRPQLSVPGRGVAARGLRPTRGAHSWCHHAECLRIGDVGLQDLGIWAERGNSAQDAGNFVFFYSFLSPVF